MVFFVSFMFSMHTITNTFTLTLYAFELPFFYNCYDYFIIFWIIYRNISG